MHLPSPLAALIRSSYRVASPPFLPNHQGDLGAYRSAPGSKACFALAQGFLSAFDLPFTLVTGNHDLEGFDDFQSDQANLAAWRETFGMHHFWARDCGSHLLIGLSTVRFRDAEHSSHEVFIDDDQMDWFVKTLAANKGKPTLVFTHAPIMCARNSACRASPPLPDRAPCHPAAHRCADARSRRCGCLRRFMLC